MSSDLQRHIEETKLCDTHEHLRGEDVWVNQGPDILQDLFGQYPKADLVVAGASEEAVRRLLDASDPDIASRFRGVEKAWEAMRRTGYGEAVSILAREIYGLPELTPEGLAKAAGRGAELQRPGERLRLLRDVARLDHVQVDHFSWSCLPDQSGPEFFLYDLSWADFCSGRINVDRLHGETGIRIRGLSDLDDAMAAIVAKYGPLAIAAKSQHAYNRTLKWEPRLRSDAEAALRRILWFPDDVRAEDRLCLGDWCTARGVELMIQYNLPLKIHTGYYAGYGRMPVERIRPGHLWPLLTAYPDARFVLMHVGYPYYDEILAIAKHYPNVWVDLCWAWSIDPRSTSEFVRRFLHTAPVNKILAFGGDTTWPTHAAAYAIQARRWLARTLQAEVDEGDLTEKEAITVATRLMRDNQYDLFPLEETRKAILNASAA